MRSSAPQGLVLAVLDLVPNLSVVDTFLLSDVPGLVALEKKVGGGFAKEEVLGGAESTRQSPAWQQATGRLEWAAVQPGEPPSSAATADSRSRVGPHARTSATTSGASLSSSSVMSVVA